jgi:hypothetical protein
MKTIERIVSDALLLPVDDRIAVAHRLLASAQGETGEDLDALWDAEIRARVLRYKKGETASLNGPEVIAELDKILGR